MTALLIRAFGISVPDVRFPELRERQENRSGCLLGNQQGECYIGATRPNGSSSVQEMTTSKTISAAEVRRFSPPGAGRCRPYKKRGLNVDISQRCSAGDKC
jgi:hypothetical protein